MQGPQHGASTSAPAFTNFSIRPAFRVLRYSSGMPDYEDPDFRAEPFLSQYFSNFLKIFETSVRTRADKNLIKVCAGDFADGNAGIHVMRNGNSGFEICNIVGAFLCKACIRIAIKIERLIFRRPFIYSHVTLSGQQSLLAPISIAMLQASSARPCPSSLPSYP